MKQATHSTPIDCMHTSLYICNYNGLQVSGVTKFGVTRAATDGVTYILPKKPATFSQSSPSAK